MARIPGVPDIEPVLMDPRTAGRGGQAIAEAGQEIEGEAGEFLGIETHIREAQKHVDTLAAQNQLAASEAQFKQELENTTNSRAVPEVIKQQHDNLNQISIQWGKSPAAVEIQMQTEALRPRVDIIGQQQQIKLMGAENKVQTDEQTRKLLPEIVTAIRNGNTEAAAAIRAHVEQMHTDAVAKHLEWDADKQQAMDAFKIQVQDGVNQASIVSPNPQERKAAIAQLKNGGSGPLDLTDLSPGKINAMREEAMQTDKRLTELSESQNLNGALNVKDTAFSGPEFKNSDGTPNFEARQKALEDGDWLKKYGIVDENGKPDRVMAEKLSADEERQRTYRNQEQADKDEKTVEKVSPLIDEGKMSRAQIDQIPGLSNRARSLLIRQWTENYRLNRSMVIAERQESRQGKEDKDSELIANAYLDIASGKILDPMVVKTTPGLSQKGKAQIVSAITSSKQQPDYLAAMRSISDSIPLPRRPAAGADEEQLTQYTDQNNRQLSTYAQTVDAFTQRVNDHPEEGKAVSAQKVLEPVVQKQIHDKIDQIFGAAPQPKARFSFAPIAQNFTSTMREALGDTLPDGGMKTFTDAGKTYQIPADEVDEFKKDHPDAR